MTDNQDHPDNYFDGRPTKNVAAFGGGQWGVMVDIDDEEPLMVGDVVRVKVTTSQGRYWFQNTRIEALDTKGGSFALGLKTDLAADFEKPVPHPDDLTAEHPDQHVLDDYELHVGTYEYGYGE